MPFSNQVLSTYSIFSEMYKHEDVCREKKYSAEKRKLYRNKHLKPLLDKLKEWIEEECIKVTPKSPIGKAMSYTQNQWPKLKRVLEDGRLELDNNPVENKIRPLALGRKNYLFAGSHPAAQRIAMMYSFFASCKLNDVNPREWLTYVLENVNDTKITDIHTLLPNNFNPPNLYM
jgi:transposase